MDEMSEHLQSLVKPIFPPQAMVQTMSRSGGYLISASWRLGSGRMDNWSKEIQVLIPSEVAERYAKLNEKGKSKADANLVSFIKLKLSDFRPEHDRPRFLLPPVETWEIKFEDIFPPRK